jgi:hypothetical protein
VCTSAFPQTCSKLTHTHTHSHTLTRAHTHAHTHTHTHTHTLTHTKQGTRWRSWLRHCATSRKVMSSIPDGVIGIFHWHNPSGRTMAVGSTLTETSTRNISWGEGGGWRRPVRRADNLPPSCANCVEIWEPQPPGTVWACNRPVPYMHCFTSIYIYGFCLPANIKSR